MICDSCGVGEYVYTLFQENMDDEDREDFLGVYATEAAALRDREAFCDASTLEIYGHNPFHIRREMLRSL